MSIKTILVPLDELPRCHLRVELAARLAQQHGAHLVGLSPTGLFEMPVQLGATLGGATDYVQLSSNYLDQRAREIATEFKAEARKLGVESFEARIAEAEPLPATVMHSRGSDLIVVGQTDPGSVAPMAGDFPQQVVMHAGRPVLIVPFAGRFATVVRIPEAFAVIADAPGGGRRAARTVGYCCVEPPTSEGGSEA